MKIITHKIGSLIAGSFVGMLINGTLFSRDEKMFVLQQQIDEKWIVYTNLRCLLR